MNPSTILEHALRRERGPVIAALVRACGDLDLAEDALQDACGQALVTWPTRGIPERPGAWLLTVARRKLIDEVRRGGLRDDAALDRVQSLAPLPDDVLADPATASGIADDTLRLLFACCHPSLSRDARLALTLRTLGGLTTREIARAFLEQEQATAQRLVRAQRKISDAGIPFSIPAREELPERVDDVLSVLYLMFNEGHTSTHDDELVRVALCEEALRLVRALLTVLRERDVVHDEASAVLALFALTHARTPARIDADGIPVPLDEQDRSRWDRALIEEGLAHIDRVVGCGAPPTAFVVQACIAALHARAATAAETDWAQIAGLYGGLLRILPSPVVELNAAVAIAMASDIDKGLAWIDSIEQRGLLPGYHLLPAARASLFARQARYREALVALEAALALVRSPGERRFLERQRERWLTAT